MPQFESRTELDATPQQLFEYILNPANLQAIAPPESNLVFVEAPTLISLGSRLVCKVQAYGMVQQMAYEIVEFVSHERYREKMVEGPLQLWLNDYIIEALPSGNVALVNRIEFEPPAGLLGLIVTSTRIIDVLEDAFDYRGKVLKKVFVK